MEAEVGKYGIWLSEGDMQIIEKALDWLENSSWCQHIINIFF